MLTSHSIAVSNVRNTFLVVWHTLTFAVKITGKHAISCHVVTKIIIAGIHRNSTSNEKTLLYVKCHDVINIDFPHLITNKPPLSQCKMQSGVQYMTNSCVIPINKFALYLPSKTWMSIPLHISYTAC